jgi:hypothetical protein
MNKKIGKNEASHNLTKTMVKMTVSIMAVILFIGTAIQPALAGTSTTQGIESEPNEEECNLCPKSSENQPDLPICETCVEAVEFAVDYMIDYVNETIYEKGEDDTFYGMNIAAAIVRGLIDGVIKSGFRFDIGHGELAENVFVWLDKEIYKDQWYIGTKIIALLASIAAGITEKLLSLCRNDDDTKGRVPTTPLMILITKLKSIISRFLIKLHMIRP